MNGYANTCEAVPVPAAPGTMKDIMLETTATLGRVSQTLDMIWSLVTETGMDMGTPTDCAKTCLMATAVTANYLANELMAKAERLCKVLGV